MKVIPHFWPMLLLSSMSCHDKQNPIHMTSPGQPGTSLAFDSDIWKSKAKQTTNETRFYMLYDLVNNHLKVGSSAKELTMKLGQPDFREVDFERTGNPIWAYKLYKDFVGRHGAVPGEMPVLELRFDGQGRLVRHVTRTRKEWQLWENKE